MKYIFTLLVVASLGLVPLFGSLAAKSPSQRHVFEPETLVQTPTVHEASAVTASPSVLADQDEQEPGLSSNQLLMRDKLKHMNGILEGLTLNSNEKVAENAKLLAMISRATSWHVPDPTPKYQRLSKNFQEQAKDLERHALEGNVEAATLDLVRMNVTCTDCHQHMHEQKGRSR